MWNQTKITELLNIKYPVLLGPMGGGFSTVELLASVSNAGGLGSFGAYTLSPDEIINVDKEIRKRTVKPFNINLWVSDVDEQSFNLSAEKVAKVKAMFQPYFDELSIPMPELSLDVASRFEKQVEAIFKIKPAVFSFIFGIPAKEILNECKKLQIRTIGSATTLDEALALEEAQVDAIIAAGFETGGHRPSFLKPAQDSLVGTFTLIQQLKAKITKPLIAAGGIADGKGLAAALVLGADAVQIGTAFLGCNESGATKAHKDILRADVAHNTVLAKSFTGRLGRMIQNRIGDEIKQEADILPFPLQGRLLAALKEAAAIQGKTDLLNFWSGQNNTNLKHTVATALMESIIEEANSVFRKEVL